jgi:hypothetical protein
MANVMRRGPLAAWLLFAAVLLLLAMLGDNGMDWVFRVVVIAAVVAASVVGLPVELRDWLFGRR